MARREDQWLEDERVLALHLYLAHRNERLGKTHPKVKALSETLHQLAQRDGRAIPEKFRNPAGMEMQLSKFLDLEDPPKLKGFGKPSKWHAEVWAQYIDDRNALQRRFGEIMSTLDGAPRSSSPPALQSPTSEAREAYGRRTSKAPREDLFDEFGPEAPEQPRAQAAPIELDASKQDAADAKHDELRMALQRFLDLHGYQVHNSVKRRQGGAEVIRFDLAATLGPAALLFEVKSLPEGGSDHDVLRKGLGQLLWYRSRWRRLVTEPCVAVLCVEREPICRKEWLAACNDVGVVLTWPQRFEALLAECSAIAALSGVPSFA